MTVVNAFSTPRLVCERCGQSKPESAFDRCYDARDGRAQPCKACRATPQTAKPDPRLEAAKEVAILVTRALRVCEQATLELPACLLADALNCLIEDWGAPTDVAGGRGVSWSAPPVPSPGSEDASPPATPEDEP